MPAIRVGAQASRESGRGAPQTDAMRPKAKPQKPDAGHPAGPAAHSHSQLRLAEAEAVAAQLAALGEPLPRQRPASPLRRQSAVSMRPVPTPDGQPVLPDQLIRKGVPLRSRPNVPDRSRLPWPLL